MTDTITANCDRGCTGAMGGPRLDQCPKIRSARANSRHTKPMPAAINTTSKRKRFLVMGAKYRFCLSPQLSSTINLSDQH